MKTVVKNLFNTYFGTSDRDNFKGEGARNSITRTQMVGKLKRDKGAYSNVETRIAYAEIIKQCDRGEAEELRLLMGISRGTHYQWLRDATAYHNGELKVRTVVIRS